MQDPYRHPERAVIHVEGVAEDPHHSVLPGADVHYLAVSIGLLGLFMVTEVAVAVFSHSLALLADAGHMLTDVAALGMAIAAIRLAARPASGRWSFGFQRAEILSAAANGVTLLVVSVLVAVEAIYRLIHPSAVRGLAVVIVAVVGLVVNLLATWSLSRANRSSLNIEGAFRHVVTDLYGFIGTAIAGVLILTAGFDRADSVASLVVVILMVHASLGLLRESGSILLEAAPERIDLEEIRVHLMAVPHVSDLHDLHCWTVTSDLLAISAHVVVDESCFEDGHAPQILDELQSCLAGHFDVEHSTFQLEHPSHIDHELGAHGTLRS